MLKGWSNILTVACITIAGIVEAGQQALKDAPTVAALVPSFVRGNFWNYVPLIFLIAAGAIWIFGRFGSSRPATQTALQNDKLTIHSAVYGTAPQDDVDVTQKLRTAARDGLTVPVNNNFLGCDPLPMKVKRLQVQYSYGGPSIFSVSRTEGSRLVLPEDSELQRLASEVEQARRQLPAKDHDVLLSPLQKDALSLSGELLAFLKRLGPPPAPNYTAEDIDNMPSSQMKALINAGDGEFAEACEYYRKDVNPFSSEHGLSNQITARWRRLYPWYQKLEAAYALEFRNKVDTLRNRFLVEGITDKGALALPIEGKDGERNARTIAATLWELAYQAGSNAT
jgi:hypothetical protein